MNKGFTLVELLIVFVVIGILTALVIPAWQSRDNPTVTLKMDEWACTKTGMKTRTQMVLMGKLVMPQTVTETVCVEFRRHGG